MLGFVKNIKLLFCFTQKAIFVCRTVSYDAGSLCDIP